MRSLRCFTSQWPNFVHKTNPHTHQPILLTEKTDVVENGWKCQNSLPLLCYRENITVGNSR